MGKILKLLENNRVMGSRQRFWPHWFESNECFSPTNTDLFNFVWSVTVPGFWLKVGKEIAFNQSFRQLTKMVIL